MQQHKNYPTTAWEYIAAPEDVGWSTKQLRVTKAFLDILGSAAILIITGGKILAEWGDVARRFPCHSMRKSLLSSLFGIAIQEGSIDPMQTLDELAIDDNEPMLTLQEKQATILDLLKARSGIYHPASCQPNDRLPGRGSHMPGTFWHYNNWDFNTLGTIFEQCTETSLFATFQQQIAVPLQMEDFAFSDTFYRGGGPDALHPAYWFRMQPDELKQRGTGFLCRTEWQNVDSVSLQSLDDFPADASTYYMGTNVSIHQCIIIQKSV